MAKVFKKRIAFRLCALALISVLLFAALPKEQVKGTLAYGVKFKTCKNVFSAEDVSVPPTTEESTTEEPTTEDRGDKPVKPEIPNTEGTILLIGFALVSMGISAAVIILTQNKKAIKIKKRGKGHENQ